MKRKVEERESGRSQARLVNLRTHQHHVSKMLRARQRAHERLKYAGIEGARKKGDERTFYSRLRAMAGRDNRQPPPASMQRPEAAGGGMTSTAPEAERVWADHYTTASAVREDDDDFDVHHLYDVRRAVRDEAAAPIDRQEEEMSELNSPIALAEVRRALAAAATGRAAGPDGLTVAMLRRGGAVMLRALLRLLSVMWRAEHVPDAWLMAYLVPIYKGSGARTDPNSYRPIALMSAIAKLYEAVLQQRVTHHVETSGAIRDEQAGFRRGRSCGDHVFVLSELVAMRRERRQHTYLCYLDMSKAYDCTWRDGLWKRLLEVGVKGKMWRVIRDTYRRVRSGIVLDDRVTPPIETAEGLRQGSCLSPILFTIFIDSVVTSGGASVLASALVTAAKEAGAATTTAHRCAP